MYRLVYSLYIKATLRDMYKIYIVKTYSAMSENKFDDYLNELDSIEDIVNELETTDLSYHFRIHPKTTYILFGDLDHYKGTIEEFRAILQQFLARNYNLMFDDTDFKYTKNNSKEGSYHFSIPKWNLKTEKLKEIFTKLSNDNKNIFTNGNEKCIDTSIYSEHWFRCPNQSKGYSNDNTKHIIEYGEMKDFIIDYIPENSTNIDNIKSIELKANNSNNKKNNKSSRIQNHENTLIVPTSNTVIQQSPTAVIQSEELLSTILTKPELYKKLFDDCYKPIRFENYEYWMQVGMAIKNTILDYDQALQLYIYFSSKGNNYKGENDIIKKFNSYKILVNGYTAKTLFQMAYEDNKQNTQTIFSNNKLQFEPTEFCKYIKLLVGRYYFYKVDNNKDYKLYCYNGKYWINDDVQFKKFISTDLYEFLKDILVNVYWYIERDVQTYKNKLDKLKTIKYKNEIIETYKEYNARNDITFDDKWWLVGFNNTVYDLKECKFREYEPEDYITITTGYDWREPTDCEIDTVNNLINQIMPIEAERELFLQILASGLDGRCYENFIVFNGGGGNGKGLINDLMLCCIGNYGMIGNNNLLFEASKMGSNPEKANMHKKRYVVFREPPENKKFENSVIKEITGGGYISARGHYESHTQKELNNTTICECNQKPLFKDTITNGDIRRIIDIYFMSSFTKDITLIDEDNHIYLANSDYKTKEFREQHKYALFKILTNYHKKLTRECHNNFVIPQSVAKRTQEYLEQSCDVVGWFKEFYTEEADSYIKIGDIYNEFRKSEFYINLNKTNKEKYTKHKFFDYMKTNIFFKRYYVDRYQDIRYYIKNWKKKEYENDM